MPFGTELLEWAGEKDRRYYTASKMAKGMASYTSALHDLGFFFKKVCTGQVSSNSQPVSAWARSWGWDWRKALRFITRVLRDLFNLNVALKKAKALKERIEAGYRAQQEKARKYMRKIRGTSEEDIKNTYNEDETEDERLFLDAMAALAKTNPAYYRATIKEKLLKKDEITVANYQTWIAKNRNKKIEKNVDSDEIEAILKTKLIVGYKVVNFYKKEENTYHIVFENGFENDMTIEQIIENAK